MAKVVTVFGLSGVGKSWMISRYAAAANVAHIQASQLMRDAKAALVGVPVTSEHLRRGPVLDNQSLLTDAFAKVLAAEAPPIIFDGHCLIDAGEHLFEIPVDVIRQLHPSGIVLVCAPADEIAGRRESDNSPTAGSHHLCIVSTAESVRGYLSMSTESGPWIFTE